MRPYLLFVGWLLACLLSLCRLSANKTPALSQAAKVFGLRDQATPVFKSLRSIQSFPFQKDAAICSASP